MIRITLMDVAMMNDSLNPSKENQKVLSLVLEKIWHASTEARYFGWKKIPCVGWGWSDYSWCRFEQSWKNCLKFKFEFKSFQLSHNLQVRSSHRQGWRVRRLPIGRRKNKTARCWKMLKSKIFIQLYFEKYEVCPFTSFTTGLREVVRRYFYKKNMGLGAYPKSRK